jgi:electron transport complex protein RnfD
MAEKYIVSPSPHIGKEESVSGIMFRVNLALVPAAVASVYIFGMRAFWVMALSIVSAMATEGFIQRLRNKPVTLCDGSAFMTGLLLAFNLPPHVPLWVAATGSVFAIAIVKQAFGGLGRNIFNPALAARAFLMAAWPNHMTTFTAPFFCDAVTQATPLALLKEGRVEQLAAMNLTPCGLFLGNRGGSLGEVCGLALVAGGLYLFWKKIISWHTPGCYIAAFGLFMWVFGSKEGFFRGDPVFHLLNGGLLLGAIFMATDYVTSPITRRGQVVFGMGCGLLTAVIRIWGGYPEGVCYAILMMNCAVPMIDRYIKPRRYGVS